MRFHPVLGAIGVLVAAAGLFGCAGVPHAGPRIAATAYPETRFAVFSDPHFFDVSTSEPGPAFARALRGGVELVSDCREIFARAREAMKDAAPSFVIVPGDLTRNGERAGHLLMAQSLAELEAAGMKVYVVPGNHDIRNPDARRFIADKAEKVPGIAPEDFTDIYADFGYSEAIFRDPASLSYVAEPVSGLWLVGIDACRYRENKDQAISGGAIQSPTYLWLDGILREAARRGRVVIAFMHHGVMQHFARQDTYRSWMAINDHERFARFLAERGVGAVFTGHGHAQDVTVERYDDGSFIFDVETGSLVQDPNPYRIVDMGADGRLAIRSGRITEIQGMSDFPAYAEKQLRQGVTDELVYILNRFGVTGESALLIARQGEEAALEYFRGDEPGHEPKVDATGLDCWAAFLAGFLGQPLADVSTDLVPVDNDITINLVNGEWGE